MAKMSCARRQGIRTLISLAAMLALAGCTSSSAIDPPMIATRPLSPTEKAALRNSLARTLKDPDAAQFKWMPAVVVRPDVPMDKPVGYCGLVNGKNAYGGYVGFKRFFATLTRNAQGEYDRGAIEHVEGTPITFGGTDSVDDAIETGAVTGSCRAWGFVDFSQAN